MIVNRGQRFCRALFDRKLVSLCRAALKNITQLIARAGRIQTFEAFTAHFDSSRNAITLLTR